MLLGGNNMEKIKLLSIAKKRMKGEELKDFKKLIEEYAPDMYEVFHTVGEQESVQTIIDIRPEIILLSDNLKNSLGLMRIIKQIHPTSVIFVLLSIVDDEQSAIESYMLEGAYKCYSPPIVVDSLIHDMYVALNLE